MSPDSFSAASFSFIAVLMVALIIIVIRDARSRESEARGLLRHLTQIGEKEAGAWIMQQLASNLVALLRYYTRYMPEDSPLPVTRHSFPLFGSHLAPAKGIGETRKVDLLKALLDASSHSPRAARANLARLRASAQAFLTNRTTPDFVRGPLWKQDLWSRIDGIESEHPLFNSYKPLRESDIANLLEQEGVEVVVIPSIPVLSLLLQLPATISGRQYAVLIKADQHPLVRSFVLAHEMAHWFLHVKDGEAAACLGEEWYLHSLRIHGKWAHLEDEADELALMVMFPTPYLADCEWHGRLDPKNLVNQYVVPHDALESDQLSHDMEQLARKRIEQYHAYKARFLDVRLPDRSITDGAQLESVLKLLGNDTRWFLADRTGALQKCSTTFAKLFNTQVHALVEARGNVISDFTEVTVRERIAEAMESQAETVRPMFYFTRFAAPNHAGAWFSAGVSSYPVCSTLDGSFKASLAIVKPRKMISGQ